MSKDPNTNAPPKGAPQESLEDAIYRSSLAEGNSGVRKASPMVTIPITILSYVAAAGFLVVLAKSSERVQKVIKKTTGIDLTEEQQNEVIQRLAGINKVKVTIARKLQRLIL